MLCTGTGELYFFELCKNTFCVSLLQIILHIQGGPINEAISFAMNCDDAKDIFRLTMSDIERSIRTGENFFSKIFFGVSKIFLSYTTIYFSLSHHVAGKKNASRWRRINLETTLNLQWSSNIIKWRFRNFRLVLNGLKRLYTRLYSQSCFFDLPEVRGRRYCITLFR